MVSKQLGRKQHTPALTLHSTANTDTHTQAHKHYQQIDPVACDAKQQHAVALLTSPASGHCNDSFFFLPANVIDTHAEETGQSCPTACH